MPFMRDVTLSLLGVTLLMNVSAGCAAYLLFLQVDVCVFLLFDHATIWVVEKLLWIDNTHVQLNYKRFNYSYKQLCNWGCAHTEKHTIEMPLL